MSRRDNGEGSIYEQRKGLWAASISLPNGKRKYFYAKTKRDAAEKMRRYRIRLANGTAVDETKQTVGDYLEGWILQQKMRLAPETWRGYESKLRLHLVPTIGKVRLGKLTPVQVRDLIASKLDEGHSIRHVNNIYDVLHAALEDARQMELVSRNVANLVDPPTLEESDRTALDVEQAIRLLHVLRNDRLYVFYRTLLTLGLRPGECLGLCWSAVNLEKQTLRVETTLQRHDGEWLIKQRPKNKASKQTLPLPAFMVRSLKAQLEMQNADRIAAGPLWQERGLVFTRPSGEPIWQSDANRYLAKKCEEAKVPKVTMHELRHTTPSILLALGVDQRVIMQVLRHSTIVLSANLYTHVADPMVKDALDRIDEAFGE